MPVKERSAIRRRVGRDPDPEHGGPLDSQLGFDGLEEPEADLASFVLSVHGHPVEEGYTPLSPAQARDRLPQRGGRYRFNANRPELETAVCGCPR